LEEKRGTKGEREERKRKKRPLTVEIFGYATG